MKGDVTIKRALKIILLSLLAVIVIGVAVIGITQWDNIQAAVIGLQYSEEEIDRLTVDAKTDFAEKTGIDLDAVEAMAATITPEGELISSVEDAPLLPTPEEEAAAPTRPEEEAQAPAAEQPSDEIPQKPAVPSTAKPQTAKPSTGQKPAASGKPVRDTSKVEAILARFYALQSSYVSQIEGIKNDAYAQYRALPKEQRGTSAKIRLGKTAVSRATALESQCDAKISALLKELRAALKEAGMDESLAGDVEYYYASEKSLLKAKYMSKYKKYLS